MRNLWWIGIFECEFVSNSAGILVNNSWICVLDCVFVSNDAAIFVNGFGSQQNRENIYMSQVIVCVI